MDAPRCVRAVLGAAARERVSVITHTPVTGLSLRGDAVVGVSPPVGRPSRRRKWCSPPGAGRMAWPAWREWTSLWRPPAGCWRSPVPSPTISRVVHVPGMNFRPDPSGGLVVQSGQTDATVTAETVPDPSLPGCATLLRGLQRYLPAAAGARIVAARVGVRPMPADGLTLAGAVEGRPGLALAVTHSGVTLGPLLGELLAQELCGGVPARLRKDSGPDGSCACSGPRLAPSSGPRAGRAPCGGR